jgi:hypothetical protein
MGCLEGHFPAPPLFGSHPLVFLPILSLHFLQSSPAQKHTSRPETFSSHITPKIQKLSAPWLEISCTVVNATHLCDLVTQALDILTQGVGGIDANHMHKHSATWASRHSSQYSTLQSTIFLKKTNKSFLPTGNSEYGTDFWKGEGCILEGQTSSPQHRREAKASAEYLLLDASAFAKDLPENLHALKLFVSTLWLLVEMH